METITVAAQSVSVDNSDNSVLNKGNAEINNVNESDAKQTKGNDSINAVNGGDNDGKQTEDDQESVVIEDVENKIIELNEDSEEESSLHISKAAGDLSNETKNSTKATEFVIVNAANMKVAEVANDTEATNSYAIEDIQIKDELAETITADLNTNDVLENDPMDLLELNNRSECTSSTRSQEDTDYGDDVSSIGSSSAQTGSSSSVSIFDWIKDYPWLLYEEGDDSFGYCLYCDAKINTKSQRSVKQHGLSLYHQERCENYLAFRDEEEKNGLSMKLVEIKEEFGTDSRVEALKLKRKSQSGALNNFNWRRWLENYSWLERDSVEGTIGYCKYCLMHVNVEFSYLRDRHQEGSKHKEAEKQYEESNEDRDQNKSSSANEEKDKEAAVDNSQSKNQRWLELVENEPTMARCKVCGTKMFKNNFLRHLRTNLHEHNETVYLQSQKSIKHTELDEEPTKNQQNWKLYVKHHPWMESDPVDPTFAYCKYCEKRIIYGASAAKRATHENSSQHKQNEGIFKKNSRKVNTDKKLAENGTDKENEQNDNEDNINRNVEEDDDRNEENEADNEEEDDEEEIDDEEEVDDEEDNEEENDGTKNDEDEEEDEDEDEEVDNEEEENQGKESEVENESKKRVYKLTDEWINQYAWCKRYKKDPANFIYCIYCKIPLKVSYPRTKHQSTSFHISAEKEFLDREAKKQKIPDKKQSTETSPFFEWAIPLRNNPNNYSCRYCRVRISKNYSKKQHESSKIHQINESIFKNNRRKSLRRDENTNTSNSETSKAVTQQSNVATTKKIQAFTKVVIKAPSTVTLIKQYQKKFPWLSYKRSELRSNYGHCKICDCSLFIRSLKHVLRHVRSGRHVRIMKDKKKQKLDNDQEVDANEMSANIIKKGSKEEPVTSPATINNTSQNQTKLPIIEKEATAQPLDSQKAYNYKSTIAEMKKRYSWIESSARPKHAFCRFCNLNIPLKIIFLRNHSNSRKHRSCVINYYSIDGKKSSRENIGTNNADLDNRSKCGDVDDDVMIVEENSEEILISEQDENWTIKSETMDEHEELDYLLQRSFNNTQNTSNVQRNVRKSVNAEDAPPTKRIKRSQSFRRLTDSNTSLVASLLTTPLTLASCLGPLIQQQIQQQANVSQIPQTKTNTLMMVAPDAPGSATAPLVECENTYDLFFKSISETMKKLPLDLAAEGKLRVMQIICDLELQSLKRQQSARSESVSSNNSGGLSYQATSTSAGTHPGCNSSVINDISAEQSGNGNETIITQLNMNTDASPPSATYLPSKVTNTSSVEKPATSSATSPIIGVMDKNGLQTLQFKASVSKQIPRNTTSTTITTVANSGIRCIPFKNLSQPAATDTPNTKITRIQVPINVPTQTPNPNPNSANASKNLINFRNIQITKRISTPPTSATPATGPHQTVQQTSTMTNKNSQRAFITNIQPQLQRWGCSVNGTTSHHSPISSSANHLQQLSSQQTSTPISKK